MHRFRIRAGFAALAVVLVATGCKWTGFDDTGIRSTSQKARNWLVTQQQAGGGFEVSGFDGFETPDAILAIAEEAPAAGGVERRPGPGRGPGGEDRREVRARLGRRLRRRRDQRRPGRQAHRARGQAARARRQDVRPGRRRRRARTSSPPSTRARSRTARTARSTPRSTPRWPSRLVDGAVPANTLAYIRAGQQASGGWDFANDPTAVGRRHRHHEPRDPGARRGEGEPDRHRPRAGAAVPRREPAGRAARGSRSAPTTRTAPRPRSWRSPPSAATRRRRAGATRCRRGCTGHAYTSPLAWLRSQQAADGHIASQNDAFPPVNTFATTQSIEALRRGWLPGRVPGAALLLVTPSGVSRRWSGGRSAGRSSR